MNAFRKAAVLAASLSLAFAAPALAQSDPLVGGEYLDVSAISIDDGHYLDYANHLAGMWRANQEYAKSQGWISGYEVLANVNKRAGEPDLILVVRFKDIPDAAEGERRGKMYRDHVKLTDAQMEAASGDRAKYRKVMGSQLWQVLNFRK
jgi:hypothetical protein